MPVYFFMPAFTGIQECQSEGQALSRAGAMSRDPANAGAIAFKRSGDPMIGAFSDAIVIRSFGEVPDQSSTSFDPAPVSYVQRHHRGESKGYLALLLTEPIRGATKECTATVSCGSQSIANHRRR